MRAKLIEQLSGAEKGKTFILFRIQNLNAVLLGVL